MSAARVRNPRRYRRATLTTGRLSIILAIALVTALLVGLVVVVLPSPVSTVVGLVIVAAGVFLAFWDNQHEDAAGR